MKHALAILAAALLARVPAVQDEAPDASFNAPDGKTVKLSDYRGKKAVVLLFMRGFFGEFSCFHCGKQTRAYKGAYDRVGTLGAEVLMILPGAKDAKGYLEKVGTQDDKNPDPKFTVPYPVLYDREFSACKALGIPFERADDAFPVDKPATIVISKEGKIVWRYDGKEPDDRPGVDLVLEVLKTGKPPSSIASKPTEAPKPSAPTLAWLPYEKGMETAKKEKKPVLIDFYADW